VEPTTPCATKISYNKEPFTKPTISSIRILVRQGSSGNSSGITSWISSSHLYTLHIGGSTTNFTMAGENPTIRLPEFDGEG